MMPFWESRGAKCERMSFKSLSPHIAPFRAAWMLRYGAANIQERSRWVSAQALSGFVALSHENSKIALPQTAKCGPEQSLNTIALRTGVLALATIGLIAVLGVVNVSLHPQ